MDSGILEAILILLVVSVVAVALFHRFRLPPILAYLFVGALVGPHGLAWLPDSADTRGLAEFGVVFLLFTVGLEFSVPQLIAMRREVLGLGSAQVGLTVLVAGAGAWWLGMPAAAAFVVGGVLAMSSTAIVIKQLTERVELGSRHGSLSVGVLLFQDVAVIPFLILIPALAAGSEGAVVAAVFWTIAKGALVVAAVLAAGHWLLRPLFHEIATSRSSELLTLAALLLTLAAAWGTHFAGLSLALGAFLAGMMLGETEFRHQVEADIRPFRDVLLGLFFVTIGMLLDLDLLASVGDRVAALVVALIVFKVLSIFGLALLFGVDRGVALRTGIVLAQGGEFGFVLLALMLRARLLGEETAQVLLAALVVSMALAPLLINHNGRIVKRLFADSYLRQRRQFVQDVVAQARDLSGHTIICGYGRIGQNVARFLDKEGFLYIALDLDPVRVRDARAAGERVFYGDATHLEILEAAGLARARVLVISFNDFHAAMKILPQVRRVCPEIPILVRTRDDTYLEHLQEAGATEIVPESLEASLMLSSQLMLLLDVPLSRVVRRVKNVRDDRYRLLRKYFRGQRLARRAASDSFEERIQAVALGVGCFAIGRTLADLRLEYVGAAVTAVERDGIRGDDPDPALRLRAGDVVLLYGKPADLITAERLLRSG